MKRFWFLVSLISIPFFASCNGENKPEPHESTHSITLNLTYLTSNIASTEAKEGDIIKFVLSPDTHYKLPSEITFSTNISNGKYESATGDVSFTMPGGDCSITANGTINVGKVIWKNENGDLLKMDDNVTIGTEPKYTGPVPYKAKDDSGIYKFIGWEPAIHKVTLGDNIYIARFDPITCLAAEIKIDIPKEDNELTFSFYCNGTNSITVDWGDFTITETKSHTYEKPGKYTVTICGEDITSIASLNVGRTYIEEIVLKNKISTIIDSAFVSCLNLKSIYIPSGVASIGEAAFSNCGKLETVTFGENSSLNSIKNFAFQSCSSLKYFSIPSNVTSIGQSAFAGCRNLDSVNIPTGITLINAGAFARCNFAAIFIPKNITSIGEAAFQSNPKLEEVTFENNSLLKSIGGSTFLSCTSLKKIAIPDCVTYIGNNNFDGCKSLTDVNIPNGVTTIEKGTFRGCTSLEGITIPSGITYIDQAAFVNCEKLEEVDLTQFIIKDSKKIPTFYYGAFDGCSDSLKFKVANKDMYDTFTGTDCWKIYKNNFTY